MTQLVTTTYVAILSIVSLGIGRPLNAILGNFGGWSLWISSVASALVMVINGAGLALFRLVCVNHTDYALNIHRSRVLMRRILLGQALLELQCLMMIMVGGIMAGTSLAWAFATGYSMEMGYILREASGQSIDNIKFGIRLIFSVNLIAQCCIIFELYCYISIYITMYKSDEKHKSVLSKETLTYRKKRNAITLSGQVVSFVIETILSLVVSLLLQFNPFPGFMEEPLFPILTFVSSAVVASAQILTSPELKRHYFKTL